jgi:hypothetical protein
LRSHRIEQVAAAAAELEAAARSRLHAELPQELKDLLRRAPVVVSDPDELAPIAHDCQLSLTRHVVPGLCRHERAGMSLEQRLERGPDLHGGHGEGPRRADRVGKRAQLGRQRDALLEPKQRLDLPEVTAPAVLDVIAVTGPELDRPACVPLEGRDRLVRRRCKAAPHACGTASGVGKPAQDPRRTMDQLLRELSRRDVFGVRARHRRDLNEWD